MNHEKREIHEKILFKEECFEIQGAVFDVYRERGSGFLEAVFQECLEREFRLRQIAFERQLALCLSYKCESLGSMYRPDFICHGKIIVELKAVRTLLPEHHAQVFHYLKATGFRLGLLVNFGCFPKARVERIILG